MIAALAAGLAVRPRCIHEVGAHRRCAAHARRRAIMEAEEAMLWPALARARAREARRARVFGTEWQPISWQFGISVATAHRRWEHGLSVIVWGLNGWRVPTNRGRLYVVQCASRPLRLER